MTNKERALKNLRQMYYGGRYIGTGSIVPSEVLEDFGMAIKALEKEPKTGHWIYSKETARYKEHWTCSCCKHNIIENPKYKNWITGESLDFIFCPMCGADMRGENNAE